jgi:hypothetical protein
MEFQNHIQDKNYKNFLKKTQKKKNQRSALSVVLSSQGKGSVSIKLFVVLTGMFINLASTLFITSKINICLLCFNAL